MEIFINHAVEFLINIFDMYILYRYMTIFFGDKFANKKLAVVMYGVRFGLSFLPEVLGYPPIVGTVVYVVCVFLIALCYSAKLLKKCVVTMMIFMFALLGEIVIAIVIGLSNFDLLGQTPQTEMFYEIVMELFFWAMTLVVQRFKNVGNNIPISKVLNIALIVFPISSVCLEIMIFQQPSMNEKLAGFSLFCCMITNFILIYLYDSLSKMFQERTRAAIVEREKEYYHNQAEMLKNQSEELRRFRHDFKNRMVVIEEMASEHQCDRLLEYTRQVVEKMAQTKVYSATGNFVIDSVINYKLSMAVDHGADVKANVILPEEAFMEEDDIVVVLGNLLDNAIEAIQRVLDDSFIYLDVGLEKGTLLIHIENSYDAIVCKDKQRFITRKQDVNLHGIGLQSVNNIVEKYDGVMEIENDNEKFSVDILLYV